MDNRYIKVECPHCDETHTVDRQKLCTESDIVALNSGKIDLAKCRCIAVCPTRQEKYIVPDVDCTGYLI